MSAARSKSPPAATSADLAAAAEKPSAASRAKLEFPAAVAAA